MKTLGRILIILVVFAVVVGAMVTVVNAAGSVLDRNGPRNFEELPQLQPSQSGTEFRPPEGNENRPDGGDRERERSRYGSFRIVLGMGKNAVIMGILVAAITLPKSFFKKKKKQDGMKKAAAPAFVEDDEPELDE